MKMLKIMEKRRSIRDYKDKRLNADDQKIVDDYMDSVPQIAPGVTVSLVEVADAETFYQSLNGKVGYHGVMISAPHYAVVTATKHDHAPILGGYVGEWFVLNLARHDIGACWITANHHETLIAQQINLAADQEVIGIIGYGYAESESQISNIYKNRAMGSSLKSIGYPNVQTEYSDSPTSGRLSIEDIVYLRKWGKKATIERLEELGYDDVFYYMRLAPSSVNRQPWRFIISKGEFILTVSSNDGYDDDRMARLEAGIAMLYFESAMHDSGYPGQWHFEDVANQYEIPQDYITAGTYKFN